ncbi:hypothetical protein COK23_24715 [Bacillus cereus]|nr:hypothetical protein COK23_24715 [Bacillus cereus]PGT91953.1 hypothetical protein COD18_16080 [Bacillus cereus]
MIKLGQTNKRFELSLLLAKQFLMNVTVSFSAKHEKSFSLFFRINYLFEKYIKTFIKMTEHTVYSV